MKGERRSYIKTYKRNLPLVRCVSGFLVGRLCSLDLSPGRHTQFPFTPTISRDLGKASSHVQPSHTDFLTIGAFAQVAPKEVNS